MNINNGDEIVHDIDIIKKMLHDGFERECNHVISKHEENMDGGTLYHGI